MLFSSYSQPQIILEMDFELGMEYIMQMLKRREEEKIFQRWIHGYQTIPFDEFKESIGANHIEEVDDSRDAETIVDDVIAMLGV